jgi:hypothetical protein
VRVIGDDGTLGEENDVGASLEHKMGINGSATCVLNFGDNDAMHRRARRRRRERGMSADVPPDERRAHRRRASRAWRGASRRTSTRSSTRRTASRARRIKQWKDADRARVAIIEHPDVRRMLLDMKAKVEGIRALMVKLAMHLDRRTSRRARRRGGRLPPRPGRSAHAAREGLRERPGVPHLRDRHPDVRRRGYTQGLPGRAVLPRLQDLLDLRGHQPHPGDGPRGPQAGWLLLEGAHIAEQRLADVAEGHPDRAFYEGKRHAALFFARNVLPGVVHKAQVLEAGDTSAIDIPDAAFATV